MEKTKQNTRVHYIDVIAGIMIFWMILGHCSYFSNQSVPFYSLLGFYMPWFFYKSGMFFVPRDGASLMKKDSKKLLRYFFIYSAIGWLVWACCGLVDNSLSLGDCFALTLKTFLFNGSIMGNGALWFLLSLFFVRQLSNMLINKLLHQPAILSIVSIALAALLYCFGWYNHSWWFGNLFSGMCFFILGYWLKEKEKNKWLFIASSFFFIFVVAMYLLDWIDGFPYMYMHANKMYSGNYFLFYPMALAGIIMTNNIFHFLCKHIKFRVLEYIGANSMNFYTTHWILLTLTTFVAGYFFNVRTPIVLFVILLGACIIILPFVNRILNLIKSNK